MRDWARMPEELRSQYDHVTRHHSLAPSLWTEGMVCSICGEAICQGQAFSWDHTIPMSLGGAKGRRNKATAHTLCNNVKGNWHPFSMKTPEEREMVRRMVKPSTWARLQEVWAGRAVG